MAASGREIMPALSLLEDFLGAAQAAPSAAALNR